MGELVCLRADLDATLNTVQQLEKQKGEAQKRLDDLDGQIARLTEELEETNQRLANQHKIRSEEEKLNASRYRLFGGRNSDSDVNTIPSFLFLSSTSHALLPASI